MKRRIAIVEDEPTIAANYRDAFQRYGFTVDIYADRESAETGFLIKLPDLVVIDVGLKDEFEGGFTLCRRLREQSSSLPIIFLTARDSELDVISGLRLGADDYLTKDISQAQMMARVFALLRRVDASGDQHQQSLLLCGDLKIDMERMRVFWQEQQVDLTITEIWIIQALTQHPGHVRSRQQLMDAANVVLDDNTITSHVKRIRGKFQSIDTEFTAIETVYGMGYRWIEKSA